jgi:hypothetical protein
MVAASVGLSIQDRFPSNKFRRFLDNIAGGGYTLPNETSRKVSSYRRVDDRRKLLEMLDERRVKEGLIAILQ